jgi:GNAT superfamily N-acetyltransferase
MSQDPADTTPTESQIHGLTVRCVWGEIDEPTRQALVAFWLVNGAITDPAEALRRTSEVVCLGYDASGQIVAASSVYLGLVNGKDRYWFYRMFVRPDCRRHGLATRMLRTTLQTLEKAAGDYNPPPRGVAVVTENSRLELPAVRRVLTALGLQRIGVTQAGKGLWKMDFGPPLGSVY